MPQLDIITFINQYVWVLSSITLTILLLIKYILPHIKKLIEIRSSTTDDIYSYTMHKEYAGLRKLTLYYNG